MTTSANQAPAVTYERVHADPEAFSHPLGALLVSSLFTGPYEATVPVPEDKEAPKTYVPEYGTN